MADEHDIPQIGEPAGTTDVDDRLRAAWADLTDEDHVAGPGPDAAWQGIAQALAADLGDAPVGAGAGAPRSTDAEVARPIPLRPSRSKPRMGWILGLAAALLVGVAAAAVALRPAEDAEPVVARAVLTTEDIDAPAGPTGSAALHSDGEQALLDVSLADVPDLAGGEVLEVWLIDPETGGLQSLGLTDGAGSLVVPPGVDVDRFSVVDVSVEPTDGDPGHSARSVVRGPLEPT